MDNKTQFIRAISTEMGAAIDDEQLQKLECVLIGQLDNYDLIEKTTEISVVDNSPIRYLKEFIACKKSEGKSDTTLERYWAADYEMLLDINKPLDEIETFDIRKYLMNYRTKHTPYTGVVCSNRTLEGLRKIFSSFFTWCFDNDIIPHNPIKAVSQIKYEKQIKVPYSDTDVEKVKRSCTNIRDRALVEFLYATGCRVSEVVGIDRTDIDFLKKSVMVLGKGNKQRTVYLSDVAMLYLQEYLAQRTDSNPCLFASIKDPHNRLHKCGIEQILKRLGSDSGVENVHPHRYRRTLATNLLDRGCDIQDISKLLGHTEISTTQIYCYVKQENVHNSYNKYI